MARRFSVANVPSRAVRFADEPEIRTRKYSFASKDNIQSTLSLYPEIMEDVILRSASPTDQVFSSTIFLTQFSIYSASHFFCYSVLSGLDFLCHLALSNYLNFQINTYLDIGLAWLLDFSLD